MLCEGTGTTLTALKNWINENSNRRIVFCGDYFDNGSVEQIKTFLNTVYTLKTDPIYGERIIILLGNRDLNKLRLVRENEFNSIDIDFLNRQEFGETPTYNKGKYNRTSDFPNLQEEYNKFKFYKDTMGISLGLESVSDVNKDTPETSPEKEMMIF